MRNFEKFSWREIAQKAQNPNFIIFFSRKVQLQNELYYIFLKQIKIFFFKFWIVLVQEIRRAQFSMFFQEKIGRKFNFFHIFILKTKRKVSKIFFGKILLKKPVPKDQFKKKSKQI